MCPVRGRTIRVLSGPTTVLTDVRVGSKGCAEIPRISLDLGTTRHPPGPTQPMADHTAERRMLDLMAVGLLVPVLILDVTVGRDGQVFDIELGVATSSDEFFPFQIWGWSGTSRYSDEYEDERWDWRPAQYDGAHEIDIWEVDLTDGPVVGVHVHV